MDADSRDLAREALDGLFRRRVEAGMFYCAPCLVERLKRTFPLVAVQAAVADTFERPGALSVKPGGPCEACKKRRRCIGALRPGQSTRP
jgi:hypothetical protein